MQPDAIHPTLTFSDAALMLGAATPVVRFEGRGRPVDTERICGLLSVAFGQTPSDRQIAAVKSAASHWQDGAKALANLRLVFAGLPRLEETEDILRLKAAELLFDAGLTAHDLDQSLQPASSDSGVEKFDSNQPRVPAGNADGGQWTKGIWSRFSSWLDEQVPIYDQDTGIQVGTQSRARAIATNPLTVATAGTAALAGGEVVASTAEVATEAAVVDRVAGLASNAARGLASEARVLAELGLTRNTALVRTVEGASVPDALTESLLVEIKDALRVTFSRQARIQTLAASESGRETWLIVGKGTSVSARVRSAYDRVIEWPGLGPR